MTLASITGRTDRQTDRQTDRVRRNMQPPPREEGRIISVDVFSFCTGYYALQKIFKKLNKSTLLRNVSSVT